MKKGFVAAILATALAAFALACGDTGSIDLDTGNRCDYLVLPGTMDGATLFSRTEVDCGTPLAVDLSVIVDFIQQGGGAGTTEPGTQLSAFVREKYIVTYRNITQNGASTPRSEVPEPWQRTVSSVLGADGSFPATYDLTGARILQESAKGQPPLNNDAFFTIGTDPLSGVVFEAEIVWWGHPVSQASRECRGTMVYRFTVYDAPDGSEQEAAICAEEFDALGG
jgi:hypothetical protein